MLAECLPSGPIISLGREEGWSRYREQPESVHPLARGLGVNVAVKSRPRGSLGGTVLDSVGDRSSGQRWMCFQVHERLTLRGQQTWHRDHLRCHPGGLDAQQGPRRAVDSRPEEYRSIRKRSTTVSE